MRGFWSCVGVAGLWVVCGLVARAEEVPLSQMAERESGAVERLEADVAALARSIEEDPAYAAFRAERARLRAAAWRLDMEAAHSAATEKHAAAVLDLRAKHEVLREQAMKLDGEGAMLDLRRRIQARRQTQAVHRLRLVADVQTQELIELYEARNKLEARIRSLKAELPGIQDAEVHAHNVGLIGEAEAILVKIQERLEAVNVPRARALERARETLDEEAGPTDESVLGALRKQNEATAARALDNGARTRVASHRLEAHVGTSIRPAVTEARGEVQIEGRDGVKRKASTGAILRPGERIETGSRSAASFHAGDGEALGVGPDTVVVLGPRELTFAVIRGVFHFRRFLTRWTRGVTRSRLELRIRNTTATASVRGSDVLVQASADAVYLLVREGEVTLTGLDGGEVAVPAGQWIVLRDGHPLGEPSPLDTATFTKLTRAMWR